MDDRLSTYRNKRHFDRTPEPSADSAPDGEGGRRFVIQHHDASTEHYDFRLEHDGVLLSWAVPKGPSTDPRERRLAVRTEDHPVEYVDFEGIIPEDQYGGGAVIVWDLGTWEPLDDGDDEDEVVSEALAAGHLNFSLAGTKVSGGYRLQRFGRDEDQWLLIKRRDADADARRRPTSTQPESLLSGMTVTEMARAPDA